MEKYYLLKSDKPDKKYKIIYYNHITGLNKKIYFGASGYSDYTINKDDLQKNRYILRHYRRENWNFSGRYTPGFWSRWILWNKKTILLSIDNIEKKFNIKIIYIQ